MNKKAKQVAGAVKGQSKKIIGVTAASLVIGSTMLTANAAYQDRAAQGGGMGIGKAENVAIQTALNNQDFEAWKKAEANKGNQRVLAVIDTQEEFNRLVEAHKLMKAGKSDEAAKIFQELGVPFVGGRGMMRQGGEKLNETERNTMHDAIKKGDYQTWKTLMEKRGGRILQYVNEGNFAKYAEAKKLQWEGKFTEAKKILDEIGFPFKERGTSYQDHQNGLKKGGQGQSEGMMRQYANNATQS